MGKPEAKIEDYLVAGVKARAGWAAKMADIGRRGAPDRECRFPGPLTIYVEIKDIEGDFMPGQLEYHADLRKLGYVVLVVWTMTQVDKFFSDYDRGVYG